MSEAPEDAGRSAAERIGAAAREVESGLSLSGLGLTRLPEDLRALRYLTVLDLSDNQLAELPEWLGELAALEQLVLRGNRLTQLPPMLARLGRLTQLDAADNRLLQVAPELAAMPRLATIELHGNPHLLVPPPEIVAGGGRAALEYLRGLGPEFGPGPGGVAESAVDLTLLSIPLPPPEPTWAERRRGARRKALMIGVPILAVCAAVAITAAMSGAGPGQTPASALPAAQAGTSIGAITLPPKQTSTKSATTSPHAPSYLSPTPATERASTHAAATKTTSAASTTAAGVATTASTTTTYPIAAPNVDLSANRPATGSSTMQNYGAANAVDGNPNTYWESLDGAAFPQTLTVDLGEVTTVARFDFRLPQPSDWNERTETFTILGSTNGTDFFTIEPSGTYTFNANSASDDSASLSVAPVHTRYIKLYFTATDGWPAAQMGELDVYS